jgi:osmoprotectant transport system ATP-binding protein
MSDAVIEFAHVSYLGIIRDVSLRLEAGTTTALLGRSGSGKTTLLRMVNALVMPTAGEVRVLGKATTAHNLLELRRSIGYVIQETGLFPHMTVGRNAGLALELAKSPDVPERAQAALKLAGLDPALGSRYAWQLSGGQRQRVGLARALATDPKILLMDEPFGALDPITRAEMQTTLRDLMKRLGKTVLLVTHDLDEALYLADRVVFLDQGQIKADLPANEVLTSSIPDVTSYVKAVHRAVNA